MTTLAYKPTRQGTTYPKPTVLEWRRILRRCKRVYTGWTSPCWIWTGRVDTDGYGEAKFRGAKRFTHRIAFAWKHGKAPAGRDIDHLCHQRSCCNPLHLRSADPLLNAGGRSDGGEMPEQVTKHNVGTYVTRRTDSVPF